LCIRGVTNIMTEVKKEAYMWIDCLDCDLLDHCPGRCDRMQEIINTNKALVEKEDYHEYR